MKAVFADTFYFLALLNERDPAHERAIIASKSPEQQDAIKKFSAAAPLPRQRITSRKAATQRLAKEFRAAEKCLTQGLDLLIEQFEEDYPEFVAEFKNARVVVEGPTASKSVVELKQPQATPKAA